MSKKKRLQIQKKKKHPARERVRKSNVGNLYMSEDFPEELVDLSESIFSSFYTDLYGTLEYLSDDLINQLVNGDGNWERQQLIEFRNEGWSYSRKQNCLRRTVDL